MKRIAPLLALLPLFALGASSGEHTETYAVEIDHVGASAEVLTMVDGETAGIEVVGLLCGDAHAYTVRIYCASGGGLGIVTLLDDSGGVLGQATAPAGGGWVSLSSQAADGWWRANDRGTLLVQGADVVVHTQASADRAPHMVAVRAGDAVAGCN